MATAILIGRPGSPGVGRGRLLPIRPTDPATDGPSPADPATDGSSPAGPTDEGDRLRAALAAAAADLEALAAELATRVGEDVAAIFEAQALFARDPGIVDPALALVDEGIPADEAVLRATDEQAERLASVDDAYFRERAADVRDVGRRVAGLLRGETQPELWNRDGEPAILVARDLDPSMVATIRPELVGGIALAGGAPQSHAAIVARALGIPLVLGLGTAVDSLVGGTDGAVDGSGGRLLIAPTDAELASLAPSTPVTPILAAVDALGRAPAVTIAANVGSAHEADAARLAGADGIGLVRTELLFLGRHAPPTMAEQRAAYRAILAAMPDRPVVFRTLDVGGDKPAAWQSATDANPALGVRGLRLGLRRPELLEDQLTALVEAAEARELRVMLPMVSAREELDLARERLDKVVRSVAAERGIGPSRVLLGVMIEVPAAAIMADSLAEAADFFSIGTNDLVQYTLAADRTSPDLADLAAADQPAILRLIDTVVRAASARDRHVSVCGEAAANLALVPLLVGLGVTELSVGPSSVASVRARVAGLDPDDCRELAIRALAASSVTEVRAIAAEASTIAALA
jgi:phosphoenolpyruvate-protein phosphotransferase